MLIDRRRVKMSRRDACLVLFGVGYALLGYSFLNIPEASKPLLHNQLRLALDLAPIEFYGWAWIVSGVAAIVGGLVHRLDKVGFAFGVYMPMLWGTAYLSAQVQDSVPRAWVGAVIYGLMIGGTMLVIAGMPDPQDRVKRLR